MLHQHAEGDVVPIRELPYGPAAIIAATRGRTDGSIRLRAKHSKYRLRHSGRPQMVSGHSSACSRFRVVLLPSRMSLVDVSAGLSQPGSRRRHCDRRSMPDLDPAVAQNFALPSGSTAPAAPSLRHVKRDNRTSWSR